MATFKIVPGGVYAKADEVFAREVIEITSDGDVIYNDYGLSDGAPIGQRCRCSLGRFVTWAARPLTPEEISKLRRKEANPRDLGMAVDLVRIALDAASDKQISDEFYRRGLDRLPVRDELPNSTEQSENSCEGRSMSPPSGHSGRSKERASKQRKSTS